MPNPAVESDQMTKSPPAEGLLVTLPNGSVTRVKLENIQSQFEDAVAKKDEIRKAALEIAVLAWLVPEDPLPKKPKPFLQRIGSYLLFGIFGFAGTVNGAVTTYFSLQTLLAQIPPLLHFAVTATFDTVSAVTAGFFAFVNIWLFWQFELDLLKNILDLNSHAQIKPTLKAHRTQIKVTKLINHHLANLPASAKNQKNLQTISALSALFSKDVLSKRDTLKYEESGAIQWSRWIFTGLGAIMNVSGSFFLWSKIVIAGATTATALATLSPLGWALIALGIATSLGFFITKRLSTANHNMNEFKKIGGKLKTFESEYKIHEPLIACQQELHAQNIAHQSELQRIRKKADANGTTGETIRVLNQCVNKHVTSIPAFHSDRKDHSPESPLNDTHGSASPSNSFDLSSPKPIFFLTNKADSRKTDPIVAPPLSKTPQTPSERPGIAV